MTTPSETPRTDAEIKRTSGIAAMSGCEQAWEDMCYFAKDLERELRALTAPVEREALAELVRLKDIKERMESDAGAYGADADDYDKSKEPAWEAARRALTGESNGT